MTDADLVDRAVPDALALAGAVRRRDYWEIRRILHRRTVGEHDQRRLYALVIVLAAAVPDDVPLGDLLEWATHWPEPVTEEKAAAHRAAIARQQ
ncbi:hypothetical protein [Nocardiopsis salina]|uniref:hypothetical protein n=1 Tax=Nocardiopsis salina TaxID=245836 RepID=UPI00034685FC|nr:hypothetical protein [Nocardiopsis salina]